MAGKDPSPASLASRVLDGDIRAASRLMRLCDDNDPSAIAPLFPWHAL